MYTRIWDLREEKGWNQTKMAQLFETNVDYLFGLTNNKRPYDQL